MMRHRAGSLMLVAGMVVACVAVCGIVWAQEEAPAEGPPWPETPNATQGPYVWEGSELLWHGHEEHEEHQAWEQWIVALDITALAFLVATIVLGLIRRRSPRAMLKWHVRLAIVTLVLALAHATLVILKHF